MVAGAVIDLERHVDAPLPRVERDLDAHRAIHELGRAREAIVAETRGKTKDEVHRRGRAVAGDRGCARSRQTFRPHGRPGVGVRVLVAAVALGDEPVLARAALSGGLVDDEEAAVGLDLHAHEAVLDRGVAIRLDGGSPIRRGDRRETQAAQTHAGRPLIDRHDRVFHAASFSKTLFPGLRLGCLVVPDAWLRVSFSEITDVPRQAEARDEVLRWKLRRLVPFRVDELRVNAAEVAPLPVQEEPRRLLLGFGVEQLLAQIEDAFAAHHVHIGRIADLTSALEHIDIAASSPAGFRYAAATLQQLLEAGAGAIRCMQIDDWPDFAHRGVMLDISRDKVPTMATLFMLVDLFAELKINQLQLYTEHTFQYAKHPDVWSDLSPMTPEEIRELDEYCRARFIELVPNQNSFGHMARWLKHPRYADLAEAPDGFTFPWGLRHAGGFTLNPLDPRSLELGREYVKLMVQEMPIIPLMAYNVFTVMDETYWKGYPSAETDPYTDPVPNWGNSRAMMIKLKPAK